MSKPEPICEFTKKPLMQCDYAFTACGATTISPYTGLEHGAEQCCHCGQVRFFSREPKGEVK